MKTWRHDPPRQFFARVVGLKVGWNWVAGWGFTGWRCVEKRDMGIAETRDEAWRLARLALSRLVNEQHARAS